MMSIAFNFSLAAIVLFKVVWIVRTTRQLSKKHGVRVYWDGFKLAANSQSNLNSVELQQDIEDGNKKNVQHNAVLVMSACILMVTVALYLRFAINGK